MKSRRNALQQLTWRLMESIPSKSCSPVWRSECRYRAQKTQFKSVCDVWYFVSHSFRLWEYPSDICYCKLFVRLFRYFCRHRSFFAVPSLLKSRHLALFVARSSFLFCFTFSAPSFLRVPSSFFLLLCFLLSPLPFLSLYLPSFFCFASSFLLF